MKRNSGITWVWTGIFYWISMFIAGYLLWLKPIDNILLTVFSASCFLIFLGILFTALKNTGMT